jgi:hypothetical protein
VGGLADPDVNDWGIRGCKRDKREDKWEDNVEDRGTGVGAVTVGCDAAPSIAESIGIGSEDEVLSSLDGAVATTVDFSWIAKTEDERRESRSACTPAGSLFR